MGDKCEISKYGRQRVRSVSMGDNCEISKYGRQM